MQKQLNPNAIPFIVKQPEWYGHKVPVKMAYVINGEHRGNYVYLISDFDTLWWVELASEDYHVFIEISDMIPLFAPPPYKE